MGKIGPIDITLLGVSNTKVAVEPPKSEMVPQDDDDKGLIYTWIRLSYPIV